MEVRQDAEISCLSGDRCSPIATPTTFNSRPRKVTADGGSGSIRSNWLLKARQHAGRIINDKQQDIGVGRIARRIRRTRTAGNPRSGKSPARPAPGHARSCRRPANWARRRSFLGVTDRALVRSSRKRGPVDPFGGRVLRRHHRDATSRIATGYRSPSTLDDAK